MMNISDRRTPQRRSVLGALAAVLAMRVARADAAAAVRAGEVQTSRGDCFARTASSRRALTPDEDVFVGDFVSTGVDSSLGLLLGTATKIQLAAETQLRIDRFIVNAGGILKLDRGAILYDHDPKAGADSSVVRSPFGLVAVRGTRFFAGPSNGVFGVFVERGAVMVVGVNTAVNLAPGQGTNLSAPGAEPSPPSIWAPARVAAAMARFAR
jgi:ferric-dicitrate binding protein FerR (iron transport regulator)